MSTKVLSVIGGNTVYGKEVVGLKVLSTLKKYNVEVINIMNGWNDGKFKLLLEQMQVPYFELKLGWFYITKPLWTLDSLAHLPKALYRFIKIKNRFKPDVIYFDSFRSLILLSPFIKKNSAIFHVHEEHRVIRNGAKYIRWIEPKVKTFIAVSEFIKKDMLACGVPQNKIEVIYNPIESYSGGGKQYMPNGILRIAIIGQILETKGHEDLIDALVMLKGQIAFRLNITGTGNQIFIDYIKAKATEGGISECINWCGFVNDRNELYKDVDVVVMPSRKDESFGMVAAEAGSYGCVVIAADSGGLNEIVKNAITGFVVPKRDPKAIANCLRQLYLGQLNLADIGKQAGLHIKAKFGVQQFKQDLFKILGIAQE